ncbi:glycoside hydrolase family 26 protein [Paenibacillus arenilitoris]|uniref:Copper amine oxidase n=1 Tax=Paenibacillus arenilitoris TaxID=2772299 RepID=A0A927CV11_9BACL|nr:glycosyl hydrolase [Paenibacillus arenilitoris]MBD2872351.1 copper amine oxidase [Paenibacillus arenilitoris]
MIRFGRRRSVRRDGLKRLAAFLLAGTALLLSLAQAGSAAASIPAAPKQDWTIHYVPEGSAYKLAKAEPESGVYLGAYVLQDNTIGRSMQAFNEKTGRKHASFFKYVGYGMPYPADWVEEVKAAGAFPHIAWEPNGGLAQVKDDAYLRQFAEQAGRSGVPIFLRFASEMNGTWTNYGGNPDKYKETWRAVHRIFAERAPNVAMVWTVLAMPEGTIEKFYPGDAYVDWVGVNVYNVKYHDGLRSFRASDEDPLDLLNYVYNRFSRTKPIQLSEFGVTHFNTTDGVHDTRFAAVRLSRLYRHLEHRYPRVKAVYYFNVNNVAEPNEARRINDYSLTGEPELLAAYRLATASEHFLDRPVPAALAGSYVAQRFTYRGRVFKEGGVLYADELFYTRMMMLGISFAPDGRPGLAAVSAQKNGRYRMSAPIKVVRRNIWTGTTTSGGRRIYRTVRALPLRQVVQAAGLRVHLRGNNIYIQE